ncbi:MAG: adenylyltransferase/cytidyltransferase family protein [Patescibacteria group bacterium]
MAKKRVLASGVFDVLHPGHLHYLTEAKRHGDHLTVIVTSDAQAAREKRPPRYPATERAGQVAALGAVDEAVVGAEPYDLLGMVRELRPEVIALGHDQPFDPTELVRTLQTAGLTVRVVRCSEQPGARTSDLLDE